jgi:hypothetical protein
MREEEEKSKIQESLRNGTKGKGEKDNYKKFCRGCFIEYEIDDIQKCPHCNYDLISKEVLSNIEIITFLLYSNVMQN